MPHTKKATWAGAGLFLVGLLVAFMPVSAAGQSCGSVLSPSVGVPRVISGEVVWSTPAACDTLLSLIQIPVAVLLISGAALVLGALLVRMRQEWVTGRDSA